MTTSDSTKLEVSEIARRLNEVGVPPALDGWQAQLLIAVWRRLAQGTPISDDELTSLTKEAGVDPADGREFIGNMSEKDANENFVGVAGLSLNDYAHRFHVDGNSLTTWCAWDALFLPPALRKSAIVESEAADTGEQIRIEVDENGVQNVNIPDVSVSIVLLDPDTDQVESVEQIYMTFCHNVLFFASHEKAEEWAAEKPYQVAVLSIDEAFELGKQAFASLLKHA